MLGISSISAASISSPINIAWQASNNLTSNTSFSELANLLAAPLKTYLVSGYTMADIPGAVYSTPVYIQSYTSVYQDIAVRIPGAIPFSGLPWGNPWGNLRPRS